MVISRTKFDISREQIEAIFLHAQLGPVRDIRVLGAGEFNSAFAVETDGGTYALKVGANNAAVQIYEQDMMKSEVHWYQVMRERTDIRVPRVYVTDFSQSIVPTNYFIMEFISGVQKDEMAFTPEQAIKADREIARLVAKLHRVPGEKFGYIQCGLHDSWDLALESIIGNLIRDAGKLDLPAPGAEKVLEMIRRHREVLKKAPCRLISFDAWDPNFICVSVDPDNPEFVWIDPERCLWGDPLMDFVTLGLGRWKLGEKQEVLEAYNALAEFPVTATREEEIRYAFGLCYLAVIMDVEKHYRYTPELPTWHRSVEFSKLLYDLGFSMLEA